MSRQFLSSSPRRRGGGFTLEVQHFEVAAEYLSGSLEAQAFARRMVIGCHHVVELTGAEHGDVGLAGQLPAHASDGVFDTALLPGGVRVTEVGSHIQLVGQSVVVREFSAVVDCECAAQRSRQRAKLAHQPLSNRSRLLIGLAPQ